MAAADSDDEDDNEQQGLLSPATAGPGSKSSPVPELDPATVAALRQRRRAEVRFEGFSEQLGDAHPFLTKPPDFP